MARRVTAHESGRNRIRTAHGRRWHCTSRGHIFTCVGMPARGMRGRSVTEASKNAVNTRASEPASVFHEPGAAGSISRSVIAYRPFRVAIRIEQALPDCLVD